MSSNHHHRPVWAPLIAKCKRTPHTHAHHTHTHTHRNLRTPIKRALVKVLDSGLISAPLRAHGHARHNTLITRQVGLVLTLHTHHTHTTTHTHHTTHPTDLHQLNVIAQKLRDTLTDHKATEQKGMTFEPRPGKIPSQ